MLSLGTITNMTAISQRVIEAFLRGEFIGDKISQWWELVARYGKPSKMMKFTNPQMIFDVRGEYAVMVGRKSFILTVE